MGSSSTVKPLERLETIAGRSMFVLEAGQGSPAVIFEAGIVDSSRAWHAVQGEVAKHTQTFSYDRAGCGQSQWAGRGRTCADVVDDLTLLTERFALTEPFIFVAHSFGGFVARTFAARHPDRLAGLVLVDSAQEDTVLLAPEIYRNMHLPPRHFDEPIWLTLSRHDKALHADPAFPNNLQNKEGIDFAACCEEIRKTPPLGDLPLTVISAGISNLHRSHGATGAVAEAEKAWEAMWDVCQEKLLGLSARSKRIIAEKSTHYVQRDEPEVVIGAILEQLEAARRER